MGTLNWTRLARTALLVAALTLLASPNGDTKRLVAKPAPKVSPETAEALKLAIADYNKGKYRNAVIRLEYVDRKGLCNERTHYYIGLCYQSMNQTVLAQMHYQWVLSYGTDPTLKYYAQSAYQQIAYYQGHRTYAGQGNNFERVVSNPYTNAGTVAAPSEGFS